jgi:hypothetical protein
MKKFNLKNIPIYLLSGLVGGTISYGIFNNNLEKKVSKFYEKESKKFRVDVNIEGTDSAFNFSDYKKFISSNKDNYYSTKEGFIYIFEDIEKERRENSIYENKYGQEYTYSITGNETKPQNLRITYYDKYYKNYASIVASENDEIINIYLSDNENNTNVCIRKNYFGEFEYENVDEEGAKKLYDYFQTEFLKFKKEHNLEKKIKNYQPIFKLTKKNID